MVVDCQLGDARLMSPPFGGIPPDALAAIDDVNPNWISVMSTFTTFTDPYPTAPRARVIPTNFDGESLVQTLGDADFALLMRAVELVVQAGVYSQLRLQHAMRIPARTAVRLTTLLEALSVIDGYTVGDERKVLTSIDHLPVLLLRLLGSRDSMPVLREAS
jgi:hypothetical protein